MIPSPSPPTRNLHMCLGAVHSPCCAKYIRLAVVVFLFLQSLPCLKTKSFYLDYSLPHTTLFVFRISGLLICRCSPCTRGNIGMKSRGMCTNLDTRMSPESYAKGS